MDPDRRNFLRHLLFGVERDAAKTGPHALVVVFLRGGADTLNMVVPYADDGYYRQRPTIAIAAPGKGEDRAIKVTDRYGFHPKMAPLEPLFKDGRLGIVQGVGTDNTSGSHFECQDQMEHGDGMGTHAGGGWISRHLRTREGVRPTSLTAVAIGETLPESLRGAPAASVLRSVEDIDIRTPTGDRSPAATALGKLYGAEVGVLGDQGRDTVGLFHRVSELRGKTYEPEHGASYPEDGFGGGLREVARLIKAEVGLEVACIDLGGWDTHFVQGSVDGFQANNIASLASGLAAFDLDLKNGRADVTTVVMTEFGRRIYENSSLGTDHGRGFAMMAIGDQISGGKVVGDWPALLVEEGKGPGGLKIQFDYRSVLAELLAGPVGHEKAPVIFPGFELEPVGLVRT